MSKLEQLKKKLENAEKCLFACEMATKSALAEEERQRQTVGMLKESLELALEIAEEIRVEKDDTFREVMCSLYTSGKTDGDFATAFAEANVSPPEELQLQAMEEKEASDNSEAA